MMRLVMSAGLAVAFAVSVDVSGGAFAQATLGPAVIKLAQSSELAKAVLFALVDTELSNEPNYETINSKTVPFLEKGLLKKHNVTLQPATHGGVVAFKMTVNNVDRTECQLIASIMKLNPGPVLDFAVNGIERERYSNKTCKKSLFGLGSQNRLEIIGR